jgi:hypothetical protein
MNNPTFTEQEINLEEWKQHPIYPNYEFSNLGRVRHILRPHRIFLGDVYKKSGYRRWRFGKGGKYIFMHRIISSIFDKKNFREDWDVHHKDGNKSNNRITNLEPIHHQEHSIQHTPKGSDHHNYKGPLGCFKLNGELFMIFDGERSIVNSGFNKSIPYAIANNRPKRKTHKGYTFRWLKENINYEVGKIYNLDEF